MRRGLYQPSIQRKIASSASCQVRQMCQYSNSTLIVPNQLSAIALSNESPTNPREAMMPVSTRRWLNA